MIIGGAYVSLCSSKNTSPEMLIARLSRSVYTAGLLDVGKTTLTQQQPYFIKRYLFKYLNRALNLVDRKRLGEVGGDRLCAEWVLKCGGRLRWTDSERWLTDYNNLPAENTKALLTVKDVDVSGTVVMSSGFEHLWHIDNLKSFKMHDCKYLDDNSLKQLEFTAPSLELLQVSANKNITDSGLLYIKKLVFLTDLHLKDLPKVKDKKGVYETLQKALPNCDILYPDVEDSNI